MFVNKTFHVSHVHISQKVNGVLSIMLPSKWENMSRCSTKLIHVCKKQALAMDCGQSK